MWLFTAILSAFFAGITSILAKCGIKKTDSDIATAIRTAVVLLFACIMVGITGSAKTLPAISPKSLFFLLFSGMATGASWICYFKALSLGNVNKVVPIDKSSTILSVLLAMFLFGETGHLAVRLAGVAVLAAGIFLMVEKKEAAAQKHDNRWLFYASFRQFSPHLPRFLPRSAFPVWNPTLAPPSAQRSCSSWHG